MSKRAQTQSHSYRILLRPEPEGGFTVLVPSLPGCVTYGKTIAEAQRMAEDAITCYLKSLKKDRQSIPSDASSLIGNAIVSV